MKIIGLILATISVLAAAYLGGGLDHFIDIPSICMVLSMTVGLMVYKYGPKSLVLWKLNESDRIEIAKWSGKICLHVGLFSALIGWIIMADALSDPKGFGPAFSVSILTIFYSYLLYFFIFAPLSVKETCLERENSSARSKFVA